MLNALKAVDHPGIVVVALHKEENTAVLEVRDNGPGVPPPIRDWVLQPFHSTRTEGCGLGLSTVARIVKAGGGSINIKTAPEGGACVSITLPIISATEIPSQEQLVPFKETRFFNVLLVEDDPHVSLTIAQMIKAIGHRCIHVNDGSQALQMMNEYPDLEVVITDYQMPFVNGSELVKQLRIKGDQRPVILLTGFGAAMTVHPDHHPNAILGKPVRLKQLQEVISKVMTA